jgi:hypothetical protein
VYVKLAADGTIVGVTAINNCVQFNVPWLAPNDANNATGILVFDVTVTILPLAAVEHPLELLVTTAL